MSKIIEFRAYTEFGKLDETEWIFPYDVTDEEYERLKEAYNEDISPYKIDSIKDLVEKIHEKLVNYSTNDFLENDYNMVENYIQEALENGDIDSEEEWKSDMVYSIRFDWPVEFK